MMKSIKEKEGAIYLKENKKIRLVLEKQGFLTFLSLECAHFHRGVGGCGSPVVKVSDHGRHVMSSSPVPLKTRRVGERCTLNLSRAQTFSRWGGVVVRRGECQLRFRPHHVTMVRNDAKSPRVAEQCDFNIHSLTPQRGKRVTS
ncbi:uncharacterized protein TNCV_214301 [Trichonephila clavipes]|nr:uncharacterized protein TNCV_214301 [Trichonephila clavipes]